MSFGTFCGQDPSDPDTFQRVLAKYLDESVQPAQQDLYSVLNVGNDAQHTAIVNGGAFGCDAISAPFGYIDALDATEISDITNVLGLKINPVGALKIKGAETKGNILVGDGTNTVGLPVGANGLYLKTNSGTTTGLEWATAGGSGTLTGVGAGSNIGVDTTVPAVPVVRLLSPLTSTLNLGTQNCQGTSSQITLTNGGSQANVQATLGFTSVVSATPTTKANLFNNSISVETSTDKVQMTPTYLLKTVGATKLSVGSVGSAPLNLVGAGGGADGVEINQIGSVGTTLTTNLGNLKWYPDTYISNNDSVSVAVPLPQVINQHLILNNLGLSNTSLWSDYGSGWASGYTAMATDSNGHIWLAFAGNSNIGVYDATLTTNLYNVNLTLGGNIPTINVLYANGGYMFIGGIFDTINGNATAQYGLARVLISTYAEDIMEESFNSCRGFGNGSDGVRTITEANGNLIVGGDFTTLSTSATCNRICQIQNPYSPTGGQVYTELGFGVDARVYALYFENTYNQLYVGGDFTVVQVGGSNLGYTYCAIWDFNFTNWFSVASNQFDNSVQIISPTNYGQLWIAGLFSPVGGVGQLYNTYIDPATLFYSDTSLSVPNPFFYKQAFLYGGGIIGVASAGNFYTSDTFGVWNNLSNVGGSGTITNINYWNGDWKVSLDTNSYVRSHQTLSHSCVFQGSFKYDNTSYANYTIIPRNVSQLFIGDATCSFWSIVGAGVGTFS